MNIVKIIIPLLLVIALAGCAMPAIDGQDAAMPPAESATHRFQVTGHEALLYRIEALGPSVVDLDIKNNRDPASSPGGQDACAAAQWSMNSTFDVRGGWYWSEPGPGAAARAGAAGQEIEVPGGGGGWLLAVDSSHTYDNITLEAGHSVWIRLAALGQEAESPVYRPSIDVTSVGSVRVEKVAAPHFACSSHYSGEGTHFQSSIGPALTMVRDGRVALETSTATEISAFVPVHPQYPGACQILILEAGDQVAASRETNDHCAAQYWGAAGDYEIHFEAESVDSHIRWFVWG